MGEHAAAEPPEAPHAHTETPTSLDRLVSLCSTALNAVAELGKKPVDEARPYDHAYAAADVLKAASRELEDLKASSTGEGSDDGVEAEGCRYAMVLLASRRGLVLMDTDLLGESRAAFDACLGLASQGAKSVRWTRELMKVRNGMGILATNLGDLDTALSHLKEAETLFLSGVSTSGNECSDEEDTNCGTMAVDRAFSDLKPSAEEMEQSYTLTLFYLAQVYGARKDAGESAAYCTATLSRQLHAKTYEPNDWVHNAMQMSGYYLQEKRYACAERLVAAGAKLAADHEADLDAEVAGAAALGQAKLYLQRLNDSVAARGEIETLQLPDSGPDAKLPDSLLMPCLELPPPEDLAWGSKALCSDFDGARDLFNPAMRHFREALEYYKLDGHVTEHVEIVMEISNLYRCLAAFEPDANRRVAMHSCRVKNLAPLDGEISVDHFPGLARSVQLELGNVQRHIAEVRTESGGSKKKIVAAASAAAQHLRDFLDSFHVDGKLPDRVEPENEEHLIGAMLNLGRVQNTVGCLAETAGVRNRILGHARDTMGDVVDYIARNGLEGEWQEQSDLCREMRDLLGQKLELGGRIR